ncbi:MAG: tetratricopeptide repeat protein [Acidobacteria bacterium]|nr:tetratricopeptide repeat protein [Acidobacteriota bacterium]
MKKETQPAPHESIQAPDPEIILSDNPESLPESSEETPQDPVSISKSLRRVRASGSLIIEAASKKRQEEMNQIIAQAIEGFDSGRVESAQAIPIPLQTSQADTQSELQPDEQINQTEAQPGIQEIETVTPAPAVTPSVPRRAIGPMPASMTLANTGNLGSTGQLPPNGPSTVLAQASGLNPKPGFGSKFIVGLIILALLTGSGIYFIFRDWLLTPQRIDNAERDLVSAEDQSAQWVRLGERDRKQGQYLTALEYFQRALSLTPNTPNVHYLIAQTYSHSGQMDEALRAYRALLRIAPEHLESRLQVAHILRARGNWSAAYKEYQNIIALDQSSLQAAVALEAIEAHERGETLASASNPSNARRPRTTSKKSLVLPPVTAAQAQVYLVMPRILLAPAMKPPGSLDGDKVDENPDPRTVAEARKKLGLRYLYVREYRAAINEFLATLRLTPDDKDVYYFLGSAYYGLGQFSLAHDYYKRVDRGQYMQVAQSGAQKTEKAAREESKRRTEMLKNEMNSEVRNEAKREPESGNSWGKAILNIFK